MNDVISRGGSRSQDDVNAMAAIAWLATEFVAQPETFPVFIKFAGSLGDARFTLRGLESLAELWGAECLRLIEEQGVPNV